MEKEIIPVVLCSNDNYAQPLGVTLYSMLENFSSERYKLQITILDGGISEKNKKKIYAISEKFNTPVNFILITNDYFIGFPILKHFSVVTYYRLLIPGIFKNTLGKIIYLDCDILVLGNIADLYIEEIGDNYLAAVRDFSEEIILKMESPIYNKMEKYFNAGILILNVVKMNEDNFALKSFEFIKSYADQIYYCDQDALNYLCENKWKELNSKWNIQIQKHSIESPIAPAILHFITSDKPWHAYYENFYYPTYMQYLKIAWPKFKITPAPIEITIKHTIKSIPFLSDIVQFYKKILNQ